MRATSRWEFGLLLLAVGGAARATDEDLLAGCAEVTPTFAAPAIVADEANSLVAAPTLYRTLVRASAGARWEGVLARWRVEAIGGALALRDEGPVAVAPADGAARTVYGLAADASSARLVLLDDATRSAAGADGNVPPGDSLHARPLPIRYGPDVYVVLPANDGHVRFLDEAGRELWTFVPPEGLALQAALRHPAPEASHAIGIDGEPTALVLDVNGDGRVDPASDRVLVFFGLRRGGRAYYALDVTDPRAPAFAWRIAPEGRTTAEGFVAGDDYAGLGLTFSRPRAGTVALASGTRRAALFLGGGYDAAKDTGGADDAQGAAIYVVEAATGALLRRLRHPDLRDGIASAVTPADTDGDGAVDRLVAGDTGGNVWRADLPPGAPSGWSLTRLACLGRHGGTGCAGIAATAEDRRFFHEPALVQLRDAMGRFDAVVIGSGDREDPLDRRGRVDGALFMIKDRATEIGAATAPPVDVSALASAGACSGRSCATAGWRLPLAPGEKSLAAPVVAAGNLLAATFVPDLPGSPCARGRGLLRAARVIDGGPAAGVNVDGAAVDASGAALSTSGIPAAPVYLGSRAQLTGSRDARCTLHFAVGSQLLEAPGCTRFRTAWRRAGS